MEWDLLVKGGTVVDPGQRRHAVSDIAILGTKIAQVGPELDVSQASRVIDASGKIVTPGFMDIHTHSFVSGGSVKNSLPTDVTSLANGVTTVLDAGSETGENS